MHCRIFLPIQRQYCGEYRDEESGLIYLRNRYYDCETGSFINEDPARSGINWYSYCNGNPVMFCDPLGLMSTGDVLYNTMGNMCKIYEGNENGGYTFQKLDEINREALDMWFSVIFEGESISGCVYQVPKYFTKASAKDVCWACCEVYVKNFNEAITNEEFNKQVDEVIKRTGHDNAYYYNSLPGSRKFLPQFDAIVSMLDEAGGPIYCSLKDYGEEKTAHAIVIVGAYSYKGKDHIVYYDPNLEQKEAIYKDNKIQYENHGEKEEAKLEYICKVDYDNFH